MLSSSVHFNTWFGSSLRGLANRIIIQRGTIGTRPLAGRPIARIQSLAPPTCFCLALERCGITSDLEIPVRVDDTRLQLHLLWKPHDKATVPVSALQQASLCKCAQTGGSVVDQFWCQCSIRCTFCCEAAPRAVNSGPFSCWALAGSLMLHGVSIFSLLGALQSQKMREKGKCCDSGKLQTSKEAFTAPCYPHPPLTCQCCLVLWAWLPACLPIALG